jgi:hypothetical protein
MIVDGRTMVPLRVTGEALGVQVSWDAQNRIISMTTGQETTAVNQPTSPTTTTPVQPKTVSLLRDLKPYDIQEEYSVEEFTVNGSKMMGAKVGFHGEATWNLDKKYTTQNGSTHYEYSSSPSQKRFGSQYRHYEDYVLVGRHDYQIKLVNESRTEGDPCNQVTYSSTGNYTYKLFDVDTLTYDFVSQANGLTVAAEVKSPKAAGVA